MNGRVLIFGTFDGFDEGHQFVVSEAAKLGSELFVAVARDQHVADLKHKKPHFSEQQRLERVQADPHVTSACLSDEILGTYQILQDVHPDLIALGFDQDSLKADLERWMSDQHISIPIHVIGYLPA